MKIEKKGGLMQTTRAGNWDVFHSTYYWTINLDPLHPANKVDKLNGYSKKVGEHEATDKDYLLKRKIVNLFLNGYRTRAKSIEFYKSTEFLIDKKRDPKILILYPESYEIPELNHDVIFKTHGHFLKDLYQAIKDNRDLKNLLPTSRRPKSLDSYLKVENYQFKHSHEMYAHATRCLRMDFPQGLVEDFIRNYKVLKGWP